MKFGRVAVAAGEGMILAHSLRGPGFAFRKGEVLGPTQIGLLEQTGVQTIIGARLEAGDIEENAAALRLATHVASAGVDLDRAFTGRCNLLAGAPGLVGVERHGIDAINAVDEAITVATLAPFAPVRQGEMIATVKIIPFAVRGADLERALACDAGAVRLLPYHPLRVGVVSTLLPALKQVTIGKTLDVLAARLAPAGATIVAETRVKHDAWPLADALTALPDIDLAIVFGASAITDRRDVVPAAVELAGGRVEHLGMPVDPGNLLLLGHLRRQEGSVPLIGAPGCARSPKENGFDFVLQRLLANIPVSGADLRRMGVGGLLAEISSSPQLRRDADG